MTGGNMKAELLGPTAVKIEGRQGAGQGGRRGCRGEADLAVKCRQQLGDAAADEARHLKDLLLLHLDLIQQQQELLLAKDRQIHTLRGEKDTLKCRLERMERRMALLRQKGATPDHQRETSLDVQNIKSAPPTQTLYHDDQAPGRGIKRKHSLEPVNLNRRFGQVGKPPKDRSNPCKLKLQPERTHSLRDRSNTPRKQYTPSVPSDEDCYDSTPQKPRIRRARKQNDIWQAEKAAQERLEKIQSLALKAYGHEDATLLRTDSYYVPFIEYVHVGEISPVKHTPDVEPVKVPTWRVHPVPTGYSMEGTENLDDEIFAKRHQKPEQEERRRKRWDLQRMREQQMHSRLQHKQQRAYYHSRMSDSSAQDVLSFLPDPDLIKYVEVCDKVPVSAFGYPIPYLMPMEFDLPWGDMEQREREERTKSFRGKRR